MKLRSELSELLAGFEKRMKFINIVRFLLQYNYPNAIREMIPDKEILDNMILGVLVYIKDRTLSAEQTCGVQDIARFLEQFSVVLPEEYEVDPQVLAKYIVVEVLQKGGVLAEFCTFDSTTETFKMMPVRLLNEESGSYHLTDDAFDFLFRSKEIESELDYSVTRFRLKEYMKRDNYEEALEASRELVSRIRSMKLSMDDFLQRCRENISRIAVDQYDTLIQRVRSLLEEEYGELSAIEKSAQERRRAMEQVYQNGEQDEEIRKRHRALQEIILNINLTIKEQRTLINKRASLSSSYNELILDQFEIDQFERMNFFRDILQPLQRNGEALDGAAQNLLFMLTKPRLEKRFSLENFYAPASKSAEEEEIQGIDLTQEEDQSARQIEQRNQRYLSIVKSFFAFLQGKERFAIRTFIGTLSPAELAEQCGENALPNVLMTMFAMQELDLEAWKTSERFSILPNGEFELSWCLQELPEDWLRVKRIVFQKLEQPLRFEFTADGIRKRIDMSDFQVEVIV